MKLEVKGHVINIPNDMLFTHDEKGKLMLVREEKSRFYDNNIKRGYYKCFFIMNGKIYTRNLFTTRERKEVFNEYNEAKNFTPSYI